MTETVDERAETVDDTPTQLRTWGLAGSPVNWAPQSWQYTIASLRRANTGRADVASVQEALDSDFPDAGYDAADVALAHPPVGDFTATVTDQSVRVDLAGDADLLLPDENVVWYFGDGDVVRDAGGWDHEYAGAGNYDVRLEVLVAGTVYTSTQTVTIGDPPPVVETLDPAVAARPATVFDDPEADGGPFDPADHTVDEVLSYASEHLDKVNELIEREEEGKGRVTLVDTLERLA